MTRSKKEDPAEMPVVWHCVLDREHRLLYLGNDEAEAKATLTPGAILRSAARMGDAQSAAAIAVSEARNPPTKRDT